MRARAVYPVCLDLRGRRCVVVGGGAVAERKARGLAAAGARVTVVAKTARGGLGGLARGGRIVLRRRPYAAAVLRGAFLHRRDRRPGGERPRLFRKCAARGRAGERRRRPGVVRLLSPRRRRQRRAPDRRVDRGDARRWPSASGRRSGRDTGRSTVSSSICSTGCGGGSSRRSRRGRGRRCCGRLSGAAVLRRCGGRERRPRARGWADHPRRVEAGGRTMKRPGTVYLVGAGPGDPGLITEKGKEALGRADLRALRPPGAPGAAPPRTFGRAEGLRGEGGRGQERAQSRINRTLARAARAGMTVVRLRAATRCCSGAARRRRGTSPAPGSPARSSPASPRRSRCPPPRGSRSPCGG